MSIHYNIYRAHTSGRSFWLQTQTPPSRGAVSDILASPDFSACCPYRNCCSALGLSHTLCCRHNLTSQFASIVLTIDTQHIRVVRKDTRVTQYSLISLISTLARGAIKSSAVMCTRNEWLPSDDLFEKRPTQTPQEMRFFLGIAKANRICFSLRDCTRKY